MIIQQDKDTQYDVIIDGFDPAQFEQKKGNDTYSDDRAEKIKSMFRVRLAKDVLTQAALQPDSIVLFTPLVIESEVTILFADTGIGKTVFAVQIGIEIAATKTVLYVDLELSDKQFEKRYKNQQGEHYTFPDQFFRADFMPRFQFPQGISYDQYFIQSLEQAIRETSAQVVIIDNMTRIVATDTDTARSAIPIMNNLTRLKFDNGITFVILEHNKKVDLTRPISLNDLQGSKMKANFADAIFSIGRSQADKNLRYVKQLKVRSAEHIYDTENVATYEITSEGGFLHFEPLGFGSEFEYLQPRGEDRKADNLKQRYEQIQTARKEGHRGQSLANKLGWSKAYISETEKSYRERENSKTELSKS